MEEESTDLEKTEHKEKKGPRVVQENRRRETEMRLPALLRLSRVQRVLRKEARSDP